MEAFKIKNTGSYKVGLNEIEGLEQTIHSLMVPIQRILKSKIYWTSKIDLSSVEYKSRDGFIAHSHNCGGLKIQLVIPKTEESEFEFLEFGECDHEDCPDYEETGECVSEDAGHLDAALNIWFKFEGLDEETGNAQFYIAVFGGNGDAPYFRTKYMTDIYEYEFNASDLNDLQKKAQKPIQDIINILKRGVK
jgi:hypothetical protein